MTSNSFDIEDRKGLEIVILTALLTFQDSNESYHVPKDGSFSTATTTPIPPSAPISTPNAEPPTVPPRPEPRHGLDRVAELHAVRNAQGEGDVNEVYVSEEGAVEDYAQYAEKLLKVSAPGFALRPIR